METIGQLAQRTGTSRRMLRHWEAQGLLVPAAVDPWTKQRRYASAQAGRVRAIAALREVGFRLDAIRHLLDQGLTEPRLLELLRDRESELAARIAQDSTALERVRARLRSIERDRSTITHALTLSAVPAVDLHGVTEVVADETELPDAVGRLLALLGVDEIPTADVVLTFDGTTDERVITVAAAMQDVGPAPAARPISLPRIGQAASVRLDERPSSTADARVALDAALEARGLYARGPYRQILHADGGITLVVAVSGAPACP
ncbi:DNA-binding transcriptional MerR regulator [Agrococcus sp. UYP10]|uniref:MerR family transcriptional regulator n=1 Tax=Agrococcus sp. UYP10 TaxID=1756355 RepID=UPI0033985D8C